MHDIAAWRLAGAAPDRLATHGNGLTFFAWLRTKPFNDFYFYVLLGEALNVLHEALFVQAHQIDSCAVGTGAASAADAVHIVLAHVGYLVVHYVRQVINVDTAGSDIGRHQGAHLTALETGQGLCAGCLALVAV